MSQPFPHLFSPLRVGPIELKNRLVCLPHGTAFGEDGIPTRRNQFYYRDRARGGVGLIITEATPVHPTGVNHHRKFAIYDERSVPLLAELTAAVHAEGCPLVAQLFHTGRQHSAFHSREPLWAPSAIHDPRVMEVPHEMDGDDIRELIGAFVKSARHARQAGYDGVEIHAANSTLLQQFLSPYSNQRTDEYGGSLENRQRIIFEIVDAVRQEVGTSMVVGIRICGDELIPEGFDDAQTRAFAAALDGSGQFDYISVTAGVRGNYVGDATMPLGAAVYLAEEVKTLVKVPVITAMRIKSPRQAEEIVASGRADLVGMARALIADPELPNKARDGRADEIRHCTGALQGCRRADPRMGRISCAVNAAAGYEETLGLGTLVHDDQPRRVVVVGGGPAGLEAARVAALRGHEVTLLERSKELGGQIHVITRIPNLVEFGEATAYLVHQLDKLGVTVKLGVEATVDGVLALDPHAVVVATGSAPALPKVEGASTATLLITTGSAPALPKVDATNTAVVFTATAALLGEVPGPKVVVVDALGGWESCGTADVLARRGLDVTIVSTARFVGQNLPFESIAGLYERLAERKATLRPLTALRRIEGSTVHCVDTYSKAPVTLENVAAVVFGWPNRADDGLYHALKGRVPVLSRVGDAVAPRKVDDAIRDGHRAGRAV